MAVGWSFTSGVETIVGNYGTHPVGIRRRSAGFDGSQRLSSSRRSKTAPQATRVQLDGGAGLGEFRAGENPAPMPACKQFHKCFKTEPDTRLTQVCLLCMTTHLLP